MPGPDTASIVTNTTANRTLFPKGPAFTLENFSSRDFIVKDFIESLSEGATSSSRRSTPTTSPQAFDPKPLIRTFEHALARLSDLSGDLESRENELSANVRRAEAQHSANVERLGAKLNQTIESFHRLDSSLNSSSDGIQTGGNAAVKIGERLEELDRQRRRALDAKFLIQCWFEVCEHGTLTQLDDLRRSGSGEGRVRAAHMARQLLRFSQKLDMKSWPQAHGAQPNGHSHLNGSDTYKEPGRNTREIIEKFSETLEKDLLKQFDDSYRKANFEGMRDCATVLYDFNAGASVIGTFVNQHQFFIDRSQLITEEVGGDPETWERLADPDAVPPGVEPSLQSLIDEVKVVVQEESSIIKRAFPFYEQVLGRFLQRVFQQSIQQRLEMVLEKASTISSLAFLRSLQAARSYINTLADDLKAHGLTEHPDPISAQTTTIIDQQVEELFVPYLVGSSYIEREKKNLEELYSSVMFKFTIYHSRRRRVPTTFMASLAKSGSELLSSARDAYVTRLDSSDLTATQRTMLFRVAGLKEAGSAQKQTEIEVTEEDGILSTANAKRMLKWLAEGVGRGLELSGGNETPKDVASLLHMLIGNMGAIYVETSLDAASDMAISQENSKTEPDLAYLPTVRPGVTVMHLMTICVNTVLIPLASSSIPVKREMEKARDLAVNRMEDKVNGIMQRTIDVVLNWVTKLLARQQKSDFRPRDDVLTSGSAWMEMLQTPTCTSIFAFLTRFRTLAGQALDGNNLIVFLTEVAVSVRTLLLDHFKKFQVNATGALMVTKDMTKYIDLLRSWPLDSGFHASLEILSELGNLFVIGPEALRERLRGGSALAGVDKTDLRPYLMRREDAGSVGVQSVLNAL